MVISGIKRQRLILGVAAGMQWGSSSYCSEGDIPMSGQFLGAKGRSGPVEGPAEGLCGAVPSPAPSGRAGRGNKPPWSSLSSAGKALSQGSFQREEMWELRPQNPIPELSCVFSLGSSEQEPFGGVWKEQEEAGTGEGDQEKPSAVRAWPCPLSPFPSPLPPSSPDAASGLLLDPELN